MKVIEFRIPFPSTVEEVLVLVDQYHLLVDTESSGLNDAVSVGSDLYGC